VFAIHSEIARSTAKYPLAWFELNRQLRWQHRGPVVWYLPAPATGIFFQMKKRILLGDSDESVCRMIGRVLESEGYEVLLAHDAPEAASQAAAMEPDLVLLDISLANQDGATSLLQNHPAPLIVLTARSRSGAPALLPRATVVLEKPLDLPTLLAVVEETLAVRSR
jgi:CheY-like chemotaxis protein